MDNIINYLTMHINTYEMSIFVLFLAFLGGVLSSLSPCSLGILPLVISYIGGAERKNITNFIHLILFVFGLSITMAIIGVICALTGSVASAIRPKLFLVLLTGLILIFGLNLAGLLEIKYPTIIKRLPQNTGKHEYLFPLFLGMAFGLASTPCSTPILATIMTIAAMSLDFVYATLMLLLFAFGQGIIIIIAGLFTSFLKNARTLAKYSELMTKISGYILILFAFYLYYKIFAALFI